MVLEFLLISCLILANGLFAMAEFTVVSARKPQLLPSLKESSTSPLQDFWTCFHH
jgi:CBS domain containing-hemolysin-like protein